MAGDGMTLDEIHGLVRSHAKMSQSAGLNVQTRQAITDEINSTQKALYSAHDWDMLWTEHPKALQAGLRFYDYPTTLRWDQIREASVLWAASSNLPLAYGIGINEYNAIDSRIDVRQDPAQRWMHRAHESGAPQFEVWPIPASNDQVLTFTGMQKCTRLVSATDRSVLDGDMLAMYVAAARLGGAASASGRSKLAEAQALLKSLLRTKTKSTGGFVGKLGGGPHREMPGERDVRILVARSP
jgi:hypothetical protein